MQLSQITYTQPYWIILLPLIGAASDIITGWIQASVNSSWDSTNPYMKGDRCMYNGQLYESLIDGNVWAPDAYPQGWKLVG